MSLVQLSYRCPTCGGALQFVEGKAVEIVDGKIDMDSTKPRYECETCGVAYRELLGSKYFESFPITKREKKLLRTGDIPPMKLKRDAEGKCDCPRCGDRMDFVEGQPVRIIDGKPDMENVKDHFRCPHCHSVFRRIASTDYFQWSEK